MTSDNMYMHGNPVAYLIELVWAPLAVIREAMVTLGAYTQSWHTVTNRLTSGFIGGLGGLLLALWLHTMIVSVSNHVHYALPTSKSDIQVQI